MQSHSIEAMSEQPILLTRSEAAHKNSFGHTWIFAGSVGYTGAPSLAAQGAMCVDVGLVSIACPRHIWPILAAQNLEAMVHPDHHAPWQSADAILAGPGWGMQQSERLHQLIEHRAPLVLDADALNMVARHPSLSNAVLHRPFPTVLTPHAGEAARLLSTTPHTIQQQRTIAIQALVEKFQCTVVLKGAGTLTASPQQPIRQCFRGSPRLARAGTGDVLAGMIAGLLAQAHAGQSKLHPQTWAEQAVVLHARAGEEPHWYRAGQLPSLIADLIAESYAG